MAKTVNIWIDDKHLEVPDTMTIIEAADKHGIYIPRLCYHPDLPPTANCGVCVIELSGSPVPKRACCTPVTEGMKIITNSKKLRAYRKTLVEMILSNHDVVCPTCVANNKCELQTLANNLGVDPEALPSILVKKPVDDSSLSIVRDVNKCIACGRCINVCNETQTVYALTFADRGIDSHIDTAFSLGMANSPCVNCGQCTVYCPTGALRERGEIDEVWDAILDPEKHVIVQEAPSVRVSLGEDFGLPLGSVTPKKMYAALRKIGFDSVMDTNFTADLTILEEGTECVTKLKAGEKRPLITSCSPGWIKFMETYYPDLADCVSTAKSPMSMFGVLSKTYYAQEHGIDPAKIVSVAVMPCTAKKFEARRPELRDSGFQDTDYVLTTRELIRMIKEAGIDFANLPEEEPDEGMSYYTGAGTIFGATGGVMEAAIRSAYFLVTGTELEDVEITAVRGLEGVKEAAVDVPGFGEIRVAVAHGLSNARKVMDQVREGLATKGESPWHFIEIMACPGGCVGGGGQPYGNDIASRARRGLSLYEEDRSLPVRQSHKNPEVVKIYERFLGEPNSPLALKLLHTYYFKRSVSSGQVVEQVTQKHEAH
ncbi:MAG TPA: NADH-dependent [FeFe] hydrogenase, group A6 [Candidatus Syntrophosphaera sp.]|jgi:NADH-quinone oxidoreductase subunit G|nr:NADH-dependent [FeFe] hydrogenase, group A6 [Candidatus Cloacimonadota bacterium]OQB92350.1 MAG: NADP-reducing hydrogenase subunit HndC [Candidatus Cloacimonetes bacterium ADurb.Bin117]HNU53806.1 NADH-dependent [FeFe] hydrogenase, group A6 [Candidatus Syntrophosphaera sp.]MDI9524287.1 NADH-dependent [FeFe] hydrogenase, group A6 [Candidatus Cloacimonadota bacterium]NLH93799.1 ferredoxin [Candidatus Cloacimonadota bacterium]